MTTITYLNDDTGFLRLYKGLVKDTKTIFDGIYQSNWKQEVVKMGGKTHYPKRFTCSYGNPNTTYKYSGKTEVCIPWSANPAIENLQQQVKILTHIDYNFVLCNLYTDETYKLGYHSDKEKDLDSRYYICSISLGSTREFRVQPITKKFTGLGRERPNLIKINLEDGDLLVMGGNLQTYWKHCIFESPIPCGPRINTTFRMIK